MKLYLASSAHPEDRISGLIDHTDFICLSKRNAFLHAGVLKETLPTFAVEVGGRCFGRMCEEKLELGLILDIVLQF